MRTFLDEGTLARAWKIGGPDVPEDFEAITIAEWEAGIDLSPQLVVGSSTFEFTDPATVDEKSWADKGNSQTPTTDNHNVEMLLFGDRAAGTGILSADDPRKVFTKREEWLFAVRPGQPVDVVAAAGQDYTYYKSMISVINDQPNPDGSTEKVSIRTLPRGESGRGVLVAA